MAQRRTPSRLELARTVADARAAYLAAWRWRREVETRLRVFELTFTQWLVLDATASAISQLGDDDHAVSQSEVAETCELDAMTVSQVMGTLAARGLVDRGISAAGRSYRIMLTDKGRRALQNAAASVRTATQRFRETE